MCINVKRLCKGCECNKGLPLKRRFLRFAENLINNIITLCFSIRHSLILLHKISEMAYLVCKFFGAYKIFEPCVFLSQYTVKPFVTWGLSCQPCKLAEAVTFANFIRKVPDFNRGHNATLSSGNTQIFQADVEIILKIMLSNSQIKTLKHLATYHKPNISSTFCPIRLHLVASVSFYLRFLL
jgi:hypothetical protein